MGIHSGPVSEVTDVKVKPADAETESRAGMVDLDWKPMHGLCIRRSLRFAHGVRCDQRNVADYWFNLALAGATHPPRRML